MRVQKRRGLRKSLLEEDSIVAWADAHHARTGAWPNAYTGPTVDAPEKWSTLDNALRMGLRGLPPGSSLAILLADRRGVRNKQDLPRFTAEQILAWADSHYRRTGEWPHVKSGPIEEAPGETWQGVNQALTAGRRGMPGKSSLARLLAQHGRVRRCRPLPELTEMQIAAWADSHFARTGEWPTRHSGDIPEEPEETWESVHAALIEGRRGLRGVSSLAVLLSERRGVRNIGRLPVLSVEQILSWVDAHHQRTGRWPTKLSGRIEGTPGETWGGVNRSLKVGGRGLSGGSSLAQMLAQERAVPNRASKGPLSEAEILAWADSYYGRRGQWPNRRSGPIDEAPGETWCGVDAALMSGGRKLQSGSSLARLLDERCRTCQP